MAKDHSATDVFQRRLREQVIGFVWVHFWKIAAFIVGAITGYVSFAIHLSDIRHAAADNARNEKQLAESIKELKGIVEKLVTKDQLAANVGPLKQWQDDMDRDIKAGLKLSPHPKGTPHVEPPGAGRPTTRKDLPGRQRTGDRSPPGGH